MSTELTTIGNLEETYKKYSSKSRDNGRAISDSISMLQLEATRDTIETSINTIEEIVNKPIEKTFMQRIPLIGGLVTKAEDVIEKEKQKNATVSETVSRLFEAMESKQKQISEVMKTLFKTKENLMEDHASMIEQEQQIKVIAEQDSYEGHQAKNLLVQVQSALIKTQDRVSIIDATIKSAQASSLQIAGMLPALQGELMTEMSIQAGLSELRDYKLIFDKTVDLVENINEKNSDHMQEVLSDVVELSVLTPANIQRLENTNQKRLQFQEKLKAQMIKAKDDQEKCLDKLQTIRIEQGNTAMNLLGTEAKE